MDELAVLDGGKCILQLRGVRPFLSNKYDLTKHPLYLAVSSHPGLVDLFLSQTRKAYAQEQQKTSVRDMLKKLPETTSPKISAKSKSPER